MARHWDGRVYDPLATRFPFSATTTRRRLWCSRGPWLSPRTPVHPGPRCSWAIPPSSRRASPTRWSLRYVPKLRTLPLSCRVFIRMPKAATAPTPSRSVSQCSAPFLPCPPSLGASHLPFPSAPSFTPSPVADPAARLPIFTLVFGGLCVFGRRGRPHLFSLPTCYRDRRPQFAAGHARATVPASHRPHDSKRTCCCSLLSLKTFCAAGACALAPGGHSQPPPVPSLGHGCHPVVP